MIIKYKRRFRFIQIVLIVTIICGLFPATVFAADTSPPSAPTGLTVTNNGSTFVALAWNPSVDNVAVSGYQIYRNGTAIDVVYGRTYYTDSRVSTGYSYNYTVKAIDTSGNYSSASNAVEGWAVNAADTSAPTAPPYLNAVAGETYVSLSWYASNDNVGVSGYQIYRNNTYIATVYSPGYTDSAVSRGVTYNYTVKAYDAAGNYSYASAISATTLAGDTSPPSAPYGLTASAGETYVSLSWYASSDNVGVSGYQIYRNNTYIATVYSPDYTDSAVSRGVTYNYTVKAYDAAGNYSYASAVSVTTLTGDTSPPTVPSGLTATAGETYVSLSWYSSSDNVGVSGYQVYRNGNYIATVYSPGYTDSAVSRNTTYTYSVKAYDAASNYSTASTVTATTADTISPSVPTGLAASTGETYVSLTWNASTDNVGVAGYWIYRNGTSIGTSTSPTYTDSAVSRSTTYSYTVKAYDAAGNSSSASSALSATTKADTTGPTTPTNLVANVSGTTISFYWKGSTDNVGVDKYYIYKSGNGVTDQQIATVAIAPTSSSPLVISSFLENTAYSFVVKAADAAGNYSLTSNRVSVTTPDTTAPSVPTGISASTGETYVTLTWNASTDNVGVAGYWIYRNGTSIGTSTNPTYTDSAVSWSTTYSYTVKAYDATGNSSSASSALSATTKADTTAPTTPANLVANVSGTTISFYWKGSTDNAGVDKYYIYKSGNGVTDQQIATVAVAPTSSSPLVIDSFLDNTAYSFVVKAVDAAGNYSLASNRVSVTTPDMTAPSIPLNVKAVAEQYSVSLNWTASTDNVGVTYYWIYRNGTSIGNSTTTSFIDDQVSVSTSYTYTIKAVDAALNQSAASAEVVAMTTLKPPTGLKATAATMTSISLSWNAISKAPAGTLYRLYKNGGLVGEYSGTTAANTPLRPGTVYSYTVSVVTSGGVESAQSSPAVSATTLTDNVKPSAVTDLHIVGAVGSSSTEVTLGWSEPSDNVGVVKYNLFKSVNGGNFSPIGSPSPTSATTVTLGIMAGDKYQYYLTAEDISGNISPDSNKVTIADSKAPSVPTNVKAVPDEYSVALTWNASTDNVGVSQYWIYRNGTSIGHSPSPSFVDDMVSVATSYTYTIKAVDEALNQSTASAEVTVTTVDKTKPTPPTGLKLSGETSNSITLTWNAATDNVKVIKYKVYRSTYGGAYQAFTTATNSITYKSTPLTPGTSYSFYVTALDAVPLESGASNIITSTTRVIPPPSNLKVTSGSVTESNVGLEWSAPQVTTDVARYKVYVNGIFYKRVTDTKITVGALKAFTDNIFKVQSEDIAGNASDYSNSITVKTLDAHSPSIPGNVAVTNVTASSISLEWSASTDNGNIAKYIVYRTGNGALNEPIEVSGNKQSIELNGLNQSSDYTFTITAVDEAGLESGKSAVVGDHTKPKAPTNLTIDSITLNSISFKWTSPAGNAKIVNYVIHKNGSPIDYSDNKTSYTNQPLVPNTSYTYEVTAKDSSGAVSEKSNLVTAKTTGDTQKPNPFGNLKAIFNPGDTNVTLSWDNTKDNSGTVLYTIYKSVNGGDFNPIEPNPISASQKADTVSQDITVSLSTLYKFRIRAKDQSDNYVDSNTITVISDNIKPTTPTALYEISKAKDSLTLGWNASMDASGIYGYKVYKSRPGQAEVLITSEESGISSTTNQVVVSGLNAGVVYTFTVQAVDKAGNVSDRSAAFEASTSSLIAPDAPQNLTKNLIYNNGVLTAVKLDWEASTSINTKGYNLYRSLDNGITFIKHNTNPITGTSITTYVSPSLFYQFRVKTLDTEDRESEYSNKVFVPSDPKAPRNLNAAATGVTRQIKLAWDKPTTMTGFSNYVVYKWLNGVPQKIGVTSDQFMPVTLSSDSVYTFSVRAVNSSGEESDDSNKADSPDTIPPSKPVVSYQVVKTNDPETNNLVITWTQSTDNLGVDYYNIMKKANGGAEALVWVTGSNGLEANLRRTSATVEIQSDSKYSFRLLAFDKAGNSTSSDIKILDETRAPEDPEYLKVTSHTTTQVKLEWMPGADTTTATSNLRYKIYKSVYTVNNKLVQGEEAIKITSALTETFSLSSDVNTYKFRVVTLDEAENESDGEILNVFEKSPPTIPTNLVKTANNATSVSLQWNPSTDNSNLKVTYYIYKTGNGVVDQLIASSKIASVKFALPGDGVLYTYRVAAVDWIGNVSAFSTEVIQARSTDAPSSNGGSSEYEDPFDSGNDYADQLISLARKWYGKLRYTWGGADLDLNQPVGEGENGGFSHGLDCSGFVRSLFNTLNIPGVPNLVGDSRSMANDYGEDVEGAIRADGTMDWSKLKKGDVIYVHNDPNYSKTRIDHVAIYIGKGPNNENGWIIHENGGDGAEQFVNEKSLDRPYYVNPNLAGKYLRVKRLIPSTTADVGEVSGVPMPSSYTNAINTLRNLHPTWKFNFYDAGISLEKMIDKHNNTSNLTTVAGWIDESDPKVYESGGWRKANVDGLRSTIDPVNAFTNTRIFQFMQLSFNANESLESLRGMLKGTALESLTQTFYDASKKHNVSSYYLASSALVESGGGTSPLALGIKVNGTVVYNFNGVGASTGNASSSGSQYAYNNKGSYDPWDTPEKAIYGAAEFASSDYIGRGQDTLYTFKFDLPGYLKTGAFAHEYAANIGKPNQESTPMAAAMEDAVEAKASLTFKIPVYK